MPLLPAPTGCMSDLGYESSLELTAVEAWADRVEDVAFTLPDGCTLRDAVQWLADQGFAPMQSRLEVHLQEPQANPNWDEFITQNIGVFGERRKADDRLRSGDRIEFYRALTIDPKLARSSAVEVARRMSRQARDARRLAAKG